MFIGGAGEVLMYKAEWLVFHFEKVRFRVFVYNISVSRVPSFSSRSSERSYN